MDEDREALVDPEGEELDNGAGTQSPLRCRLSAEPPDQGRDTGQHGWVCRTVRAEMQADTYVVRCCQGFCGSESSAGRRSFTFGKRCLRPWISWLV